MAALDATQLATDITAAFDLLGAQSNATKTAFINALTAAIVAYVPTTVNTTLLTAPPGGGPVTGSATLE